MKKFSLFPTAEKMPLNSYMYYAQEDLPPEMDIKPWMVIVMFALWIISWIYSPIVFLIVFGLTFIADAFNNLRFSMENVLTPESSVWKRIPYIWAGVFFIIAGIALRVEMESDKGLAVFFTLLKWYFVVIFLMMAGRLVYNIVFARALSTKKTVCTECVIARRDPFLNDIDKGTANEFYKETANEFYKDIYRSLDYADPERLKYYFSSYQRYGYSYEDGFYRLIVSEQITEKLADKDSIELFIDPQNPECFYTEWMEKRSRNNFRSWAWVMGFWVVAAAFVWWFASLGY